jgi:hypothetical protein
MKAPSADAKTRCEGPRHGRWSRQRRALLILKHCLNIEMNTEHNRDDACTIWLARPSIGKMLKIFKTRRGSARAQINGFNVPSKLIYGCVSADTMARRKANAWPENALDDQRRRVWEHDPARRRCR